jgi:uncharacterized protein (DUF488 family)
MAALRIWTIGHSTRTFEEFVGLLKSEGIELLADVRQFPGSRRFPQFNQESLRESLATSGIEYVHFLELGGRRRALPDSPNTNWRNEAFRGYADYMMTPGFRDGVSRLLKAASAKRTAIMCSEAVWWKCHRSLIADWLKANGHDVVHILSATKTEPHPFTSAARIVDGKLVYGTGSEPAFLF